MARYRFMLRPRWILSHVLILLLVVTMVNLGFWQLRRLHEKQSHNASVEKNEAVPIAPIEAIMNPDDPTSRGSELAFRRTSATGTYDTANEVIVRARSLNQRPGVWVASPLRLADGNGVVVVRGFLPSQGTLQAVPADAEPPSGPVTVEGLVQETQTRGLIGPTDPEGVRLTDIARVDVARLQQQVPYHLYPVWLQLTSSSPAQPGTEPEVLPPPTLDEGPHFSYAVQWFIFSTIAVIGYPLILRRSARNRELAEDDDNDLDDETESELVGGR
jgi:cytochrome oxidase assembly protein ShyY1